jgi:predicted esterase YcpF (UPF0227 family)
MKYLLDKENIKLEKEVIDTIYYYQDTAILYFGGMLGSSKSSTLKNIRENCKNADVVYMDYNRFNPIEARRVLDLKITQLLEKHKHIILCGNSLGGYWANFFSEKFKLPCLLINPALSPKSTLTKYDAMSPDLIKQFTDSTFHFKNKWAILGKRDELIDHAVNEKLLQGIQEVKWVDEAHRLSNYDEVVLILKKIKEL